MSTRYDEDREKAERDPRRNEAIFDGGCARFVPKEGHDFCHGQDMGIVGTIQKGPARKSKGTNLLGTPWKGASTKRPPTEAASMQRWLGCRGRLVRAALLTPPASMSAQGQACPVSRRRFWRRRPIGLPLWRIARTRLFSTRHPHCAPTRPDLKGASLGSSRPVQNCTHESPYRTYAQQIRTAEDSN